MSLRSIEEIRAWILTSIGTRAGRPVEALDPNEHFQRLGLDWQGVTGLLADLGIWLGRPVSPALAWEHPTADAAARYLAGENATTPDLPRRSMDPEEPIAIIGAGCRFPGGVTDLESFWRLLDEGRDAITEVPRSRWDVDAFYDPDPEARGKQITRYGGFVEDVDRFDPAFFNISPREAVKMDPQQRLLLETSWEALEQGGVVPGSLRGSDAGVFVGWMYKEYDFMAGLDGLDGFVSTGTTGSIASGRISYHLGITGPSITVDTACSSSLVTVHLAAQSLRRGECSLALAGGVTVMLTPTSHVEFSRLRALSPDGRIKTFSGEADGVAWGEGCGMLALKRLSDAVRAGDRILGVVRGSAVNQCGPRRDIKVPSGPLQKEVVRRALEESRLTLADLDYVECHGTGTLKGDPIEALALGNLRAETAGGRRQPLLIGSVKSNLGHPQAAAGVAGLVKVLLAMQHERLPRSIHFKTPNPRIPWAELPLRVVAESTPWPRRKTPRRAGVSSFGLSGTNAHVVLEEPPAWPQSAAPAERGAELVVLSARAADAVQAQAERLREHLQTRLDLSLPDVAFSLATTRTALEHRIAVTARSRDALLEALEAAARGETPPGTVRGQVGSERHPVAFLFTGGGAQLPGMGRALHAEWPAFRAAFDECVQLFDAELGTSLREAMWADSSTRLDEMSFMQPALFTLEYALTALWRSWGVTPDFVTGHSLGELVAACVAGVFSLKDAVRLVAARGRLMEALPPGGAMVAIEASEQEVAAALPAERAVSIAAVNSPTSVVIAGEEAAVLDVTRTLATRGHRTKRLQITRASHSPLVEPMLDGFRAVAESITYHPPTLRLVSNVTGRLASEEVTKAEYWVAHVRQTVRFASGVTALWEAGARTFIEVGPQATLLGLVPACLPDPAATLVASLKKEEAETVASLEALGQLWTSGVAVDWPGVFPAGGQRVELPTYAWQKQRYWLPVTTTAAPAGTATGHPLLGVRLPIAGPGAVFESTVSLAQHEWLGDHVVVEQVLLPAAAMVELLQAAGAQQLGTTPISLHGVVFQAPLVLPAQGETRLQVVVTGEGQASLFSQSAGSAAGTSWTLHASATLQEAVEETLPLDVAGALARCVQERGAGALYQRLSKLGLDYGPRFQGLKSLRLGSGEALGELRLSEGLSADGYALHPAVLDAALQAAGGLEESTSGLKLPFEMGRITIARPGVTPAFVHVRRVGDATSDLILATADGAPVAHVQALRLRAADPAAFGRRAESFYRVEWRESAVAESRPANGRWLIVAPANAPSAAQLTSLLPGADLVEPGQLVEALAHRPDLTGVICLWETGGEAASASNALRRATEALAVVQALRGRTLSLWWVTHGAVSTGSEGAVAPDLAALWGLGRTVMQEHPELDCHLVDLDIAGGDQLMRELALDDGESQAAWRGGRRFVARLARAPAPAEPSPLVVTVRPGSTVLITGGLGALGLHVARWLARQGVSRLVLTGRRGEQTPGAAEARAELTALGAQVSIAAVDVTDRAALADVLAAIPPDQPLRGVIHAAGARDDGLLQSQTAERFAPVFAAKVAGASHLHELTAGMELDFFLLFSSVAGVFGNAGQGSYAAANAFLDALAEHRRAQGLVAQSVAWGLWAEEERGVGLASGVDAARFRQQGMQPISGAEGVELFAQALRRRDAALVAMPLDLRALERFWQQNVPPLWRELVRPRPTPALASLLGTWREQIAALPEERRLGEVRHTVQKELARVLARVDVSDVPSDRPLQELGLDSLMAVELRNGLSRRLGKPLPATLVFDYPTVNALSGRLLEDLVPEIRPTSSVASAPVSVSNEPIAVVGMACHYPGGVSDPDSFWRLLDEGRDAISEVPRSRWDADALYDPDPEAPGKITTRFGGFLEAIDQFDPAFWGISPREAVKMDPQQRLLLETSWEALERSGFIPGRLMGSDTGVFVGFMYQEYGNLGGGLESMDGYVSTGSAGSVASGRISYQLGLKGPSITVDTACSSSLVTVHLACQSLRQGECSLALAGGVALMLTPNCFVEFSRLRGISKDGRSKSFSAAADGVGWSEGCGMLVLKRLSDAQRDGDTILGLVRGSAVNQDGRSNGLTAPNGPSQKAVIRQALSQARLTAADLDYVECHGTGTSLGDPIEAIALGGVRAEAPGDKPLLIGSVKSNMGHPQSAAGVAGIIKVLLSMQHERLPKTLHFNAPSPHIPWAELPLRVVSEPTAWPRNGTPRRAGVSSYGISGTNAHIVLEEAPLRPELPAAPERAAELAVISGKDAPAVNEQAARLVGHLRAEPESSLHDVAFSLATTRSALDHRVAVTASSRDALIRVLEAVSRGEAPAGSSRGSAGLQQPPVAFLFTGQGAQIAGMGRALHAEWPAFRTAFDECVRLFDAELGASLQEVMWSNDGRLDQTGFTQPALFTVEYALAALWRSWGITPDFVAGHSIGEVVAACFVGVLSLEDAVRLVAARGRLMQALPPGGAMVAVEATEADVSAALAPYADSVAIAAVNSPRSIVLSGAEAPVKAVAEGFAARGVRTKRLVVSHAFHSPLMDPMLAEFRRVAESITWHPPTRPLVSNLTGALVTDEVTSPEYWVRHVREPVRFAAGVSALWDAGARTFLEVGPQATLLGLISATLSDKPALLVPSLRHKRTESESILDAVGHLWTSGGAVDWAGVFPAGGRRVDLPTYSWQRERYWVPAPAAAAAPGTPTGHPLLGVRLPIAGAGAVFESTVSLDQHPWLGDHVVVEQVLLPGAAMVELLHAAGAQRLGTPAISVQTVVFQAPLVLPAQGDVRLQVVVTGDGQASLFSQPAGSAAGTPWTLHASATVQATTEETKPVDVAGTRARCADVREAGGIYETLSKLGLEYGPSFRGLKSLRLGSGEALGEIGLPDGVSAEGYALHPAVLDAALQAAGALEESASGRLKLPFEMGRVTIARPGVTPAFVHVRRVEDGRTDLTLVGADAAPVAHVHALRLQAADPAAFGRRVESFYRVEWQQRAVPESKAASGRWLIVAPAGFPGAAELASQLPGADVIESGHLIEALARTPEITGVVCHWGSAAGGSQADAALSLTTEALAVAQAVRGRKLSLWWVTQGAVCADSKEAVTPALAALWGLGRTVMQEHPELDCRLVDLDPKADGMLLRELALNDGESQVAWRGNRRLVARLVRAPAPPALPPGENYALEIKTRGRLDALAFEPAERAAPKPGEVEIEIRASGLNFKDAVNALGMLGDNPPPLGNEVAGVIVALGDGVTGLTLGQPVMALAPGAFRRFVTIDTHVVAPVPRGLSFEQAATIPVVFLTAWHALQNLAGLKRGERVLIHAVTGGVGMAAVQIARWLGAEIYATASPAKWPVAEALGIPRSHLANSRDAGFGEAFKETPMDVVLNSLAGELVDVSARLLAPGGRFIEMGKTDLRDPARFAEAHRGARYQAFDLRELEGDLLTEMFRFLEERFASSQFQPLPVRTFEMTEAEAAFRFLAQARHVGKLALRAPRSQPVRAQSTVLITGGLGALGLHVARWLARQGVARLVLTGRRGEQTPGAAEARAELTALGAQVDIVAVDVSDRAVLAQVLAAIPADQPLRGVVQAAGVIDDGLLQGQTADRLARVFAPKVAGAWHLHELTAGMDLDFFVLFSSVAGLIGNAGQGSYAAANAFLDALAEHRRAQGLVAQSLAWGLWAEEERGVGLAAGIEAARYAQQGMRSLSGSQGVELFAQALGRRDAALVAVPLDLRALERTWQRGVPPLWRELVRPRAESGTAVSSRGWRDQIAALPEERRVEEVRRAVQAELARVLARTDVTSVPTDRPLKDLGLDSLMAVELRNALGQRVGKALPATLVFDHPTVDALTRRLLEEITPEPRPAQAAAAPTTSPANEPIAVVGMACRYPGGASDPESLWRLLDEGRDAITEIPRSRWDADALYDPDPEATGKMITRFGGFLEDVDRFDPAFWGISPREAVRMDPQQRLLLETSWEALERAGIVPERLMGSDTGVFVGWTPQGYEALGGGGMSAMDGYGITGSAGSVASGRISYQLGLRGPSMTVDTACSSSLVTVHLACQALRSGECSVALAGGVTVVLTPGIFVEFSRLRGMSPDGRSKSFSAAADGTGWSEGCGMVVLKRLSDAQRDGDPILGVIRGSAVNQDGRSNGLTAPNGPAQKAVIRQALSQAQLSAADIDYVECHGTGTRLGDPIEAVALGELRAGCERGTTKPLLIGSLKSNLGHPQVAAGVAGLIKVLLSMQHERLPKNLHFDAPSPHIPWGELPLKVVTEPTQWSRNGTPRRAGVSSFGMSGTNAHLVVEEAPPRTEPVAAAAAQHAVELVVLSAKDAQAVNDEAARLREHLRAQPELSLHDVAFSLATTRSALEHRLALTSPSREALLATLEAVSRGEALPGTARGQAGAERPPVAFLFTGGGAQLPGMGRALHAEWPAFRAAFDECVQLFDAELGTSLREAMWADSSAQLDEMSFMQPALFTLEYALAALWRSWGVTPVLLTGHSLGELVAACVAGVFSLKDAVRLVAARGRLMEALPPGGAMVAIEASEQEVAAALPPDRAVSIAAVNSPTSVVIAGEEAAVLDLALNLANRDHRTKRLQITRASHSPLVEPMLAEFRGVAESITYHAPAIRLVSNVTGQLASDEVTKAEYWVRHLRQTVRFADGVQALWKAGARTFVEVGPQATLLGLVPVCLPDRSATLVASLKKGQPEAIASLEAVGQLWTTGAAVDWAGVFPAGGRRVELPTYPWQRQRYWLPMSAAAAPAGTPTGHRLLGARLPIAGPGAVFESTVSVEREPWLGDHVVVEQVLLPAAAMVELLHAAGAQRQGTAEISLEAVVFQVPLVLPAQGETRLQVVISGEGQASLFSQPAGSGAATPWTLHASATVQSTVGETVPLDVAATRARCTQEQEAGPLYERLSKLGLEYGPSFRGLKTLRVGAGETLGEIGLGEGLSPEGYGLHPAVLDAALQAASGLDDGDSGLKLPFEMGRVTIIRAGVTPKWVHVRRVGVANVDLTLAAADGAPVARVQALRLQAADPASFGRRTGSFYQVEWRESAAPENRPANGRWLIVAPASTPSAAQLASQLPGAQVAEPRQLGEALAAQPDLTGVVCLWSNAEENAPFTAALSRSTEALALVQALRGRALPIWWVTHGAVGALPQEDVAPSHAALWGLGRTVMQEHPELDCRLVDVDADAVEPLVRELGLSDGENQVAWRGGRRFVARLVRSPAPQALPPGENYAIQIKTKGSLSGLAVESAERAAPKPGEVEIEVRASGLNFKDALNALGMLPGNPEPLGGECAGIVVSLGEGVTGLTVGQAVMALAPGAFRRFVTVDARLVAPVPRGLGFEQAATIPVVFLTAWYALHDLAGLKRGERVLIHAVTGGVGMAAVQVARLLGAEVYATASLPKWPVAEAMGIPRARLANSRDSSFGDAFRDTPMDVVLNSLAGKSVDVSAGLLAAGGRFIEMGKTDVRDPAAFAQAHAGARYRAFDLREAGPERLSAIFKLLREGFESSRFHALPVRTFELTEAEAAFRYMAQARHTGKLALRARRSQAVRPASTVLITGGLGALGLHVARWLARQGVARLVLTGRRGEQTPGAAEARAELTSLGAQVSIVAVDVSDRAALAEVLAAIPPEQPLRGVVHAAGVLDDGLLQSQTTERFARVFAPKVAGAWHLHELTAGMDLDFFCLFSSVTGLLGNAGQGGYAAANAFLDALAEHRRAQGLVAQSLAWSLWADDARGLGLASGVDAAGKARLAQQGMRALSGAEGVELFAQAVTRHEAALAAVPLDLRALERAWQRGAPPLWRELIRPRGQAALAAPSRAWREQIAALPEERRIDEVRRAVQADVARVLARGAASEVPADRPLRELGFDSLMAVELRNALGQRVGKPLPATLAFDYPTVNALSRKLLDEVAPAVRPAPSQPAPAPVASTTLEPIAVVGMACRYPGGVSDPESFWRLLDEGRDAIAEIPRSRWDVDALYNPDPEARGKSTTRFGGFVDGIDRFDPAFWGISPREAVKMDPQQRLLLETSWEALERAGIVPERLAGSETGVFVGWMPQGYDVLGGGVESLDGYGVTGSAGSVASGRISYQLGLRGPSMTVDTACSSSLVTLHLACQALRQGECSLALAGGVTLMLTPTIFVEFSRLRGTARDGRSKSFSAAADGAGWSEGCGMVVLKRLSDAERDGDEILGVIRGSAVNQDGRSNGLTAPNGPSQQAVIRRALAQAQLTATDLDYVECHGTGTTLGDPIEAIALGGIRAEAGCEKPLLIGSVKSNMGHPQAAAGVAGLIKVLLAMQHERLPKTLHFDAPSPHIPWGELPLQVVAEPMPWKRNGKPRRAGISSFGISGTNAHVVVEEAPLRPEPALAPEQRVAAERAAELVVLSGKDAGAVNEHAARLGEQLRAQPQRSLHDLAFSLATTRSALEHRLALTAPSHEALLKALEAAAQGDTPAGAIRGQIGSEPRPVAFLFTGGGAQLPGMGRALHAEWPAFRTAFDECVRLFDQELGTSLQEVMWADFSARLDQMSFMQPALFTLEYSLAALWRSWGVTPELVAGHSLGELVAACVAGVFSLQDAVRLVAARGRLMEALPANGAMVAIEASEQEVSAALPADCAVSIAAVNSPTSVVLAGEETAVLGLALNLAGRGHRTKRLQITRASHSPLVEPMLAGFRQVAESIKYHSPAIRLISNLTGEMASDEVTRPEYWVRHVRQTVRFAAGVKALWEAGARTFVEVGPQATLLGLVPVCLPDQATTLVSSLKHGQPETVAILDALGHHWTSGGAVDWAGVFPAGGHRVDLPTYPWQRQRYWHATTRNARGTDEATTDPLPRAPVVPARLWRDEMAALPEQRRVLEVRRAVQREVARVLARAEPDAVPVDRALQDLGLDSLMAVELRSALGQRMGQLLPVTLVFDHPTVDGLSRWLLAQLAIAATPSAPEPVPAPRPRHSAPSMPLPEPQGRFTADRRALQAVVRRMTLSRAGIEFDAAFLQQCLARYPRLIVAISHGGAISGFPVMAALTEATLAVQPERRIVTTIHPGFWKIPVARRLLGRLVGMSQHPSYDSLLEEFESGKLVDYYAFPESEYSLYGDLEKIKPFHYHGFLEIALRTGVPILLAVHRGSENWYRAVGVSDRRLGLVDRLPSRMFESLAFKKEKVLDDLRTYGQLNVPIPLRRLQRFQIGLDLYEPALRNLSPVFTDRQRQLREEGVRMRKRMQELYDALQAGGPPNVPQPLAAVESG